ncbi:MAG TPA: hypothetical protein VGS58_05465 [Candidatus Sulfopaludibacter sp.]|nr:hypothetical protein [Candidatus Sulfopaludibacter sp.]
MSKALERLRRLRTMEEEQRSAALESALGELHALERARDAAGRSERQGRERVALSATSGDSVDRLAGLVEIECARRRARQLALRIIAAEQETGRRRKELLDKRVELRQVGTLIEKAEAREEIESGRRSQRTVDDWYGARRQRQGGDAE